MLAGVERAVTVEGCTVRYRRMGKPGARRLVLVHGGGAYAGWWAGVVPGLAERFDVVVPDLSGHGDSDYRADYSPTLWAAELAAIVEAEWAHPVDLIGHSMGGLVGIFLASRFPEAISNLVLVDSKLRWPGCDGWEPRGRPRRAKRVYPSREAVLERFRLRPPETAADPQLLSMIGRSAVGKVEEGWTWKFDPHASQRFTDVVLHRELLGVRCPVGMIYGEHSEIVGPENLSYLELRLRRRVPSIIIPGAFHHVPLDAPDECGRAIERMLDELAASQVTGRREG